MSIKVVHEEIGRFLENSTPEVLCLKGKWGVGKTYAWNYYVQEAVKTNKIPLDKYSYVSLFGLKDLEDVKYALFENTVGGTDILKGPSQNSIEKGIQWLKKRWRKTIPLITKNPFVKSYIGETEKSLFFFVRNQIVCIDDLERASKNIDVKDILGLVSYLKEHRGCKVALLLNYEKLSDKQTYDELLEKVIDTKLDFDPTPKEAADIAFPSPTGVLELLHKNCVTLGITNIRVIKKIERIVLRLEEILGKDSPLLFQAVHSATLLGWCVYQPDIAPPLDFLKDASRIHGFLKDKEKTSENEKVWQDLMRSYNYFNTDEFDANILETIQKGYFDRDDIKAVADKQIRTMKDSNSKKEFEDAWNLYHNSFDHNENQVLDALYEATKKNAKFVEPMNLDSTIVFLKKFRRKKQAVDLIKSYINIRSDDKEIFNFENSFFSRDIKDPDLIKAFKKKRSSFTDTRDPVQTLIDMVVDRGWNQEDVTLISKLTADDFYKIFKENNGVRLHQTIKGALDFGRYNNASEEMKLICRNATIALKKIGKESKMNAMRVATHGIKIEESDS